MEILPAIDLRGGKCVRLRQGDYAQETVFGEDPAEMARRWEAAGATRLHLVDLDGAKAGRPVNGEAIREIVQAVRIPCELGGGIRDDAALSLVLETWGVDRAIVGTKALQQPEWFCAAAERFPERVALGLDARDGMVATAGWLETSQTPANELARRFRASPIAAVIYTNIANDGMLQGIDGATLMDLEALADLGRPVIASGGVTTVHDIHRLAAIAERQPNLVGVIIGRALYEGTLTLPDALSAAVGQS
jgi:phosphoribosylformimino-5-aminoimidazole carboxamide ribotide isomerase